VATPLGQRRVVLPDIYTACLASGRNKAVKRTTPLGGFVLKQRERAKMQRSWAFKDDRRVMELARASKTLEEIAKTMGRSPDRIHKVAIRLGLSIKPSWNG